MRARLEVLLGPAADEVTVATFHALGLAILRENAPRPGWQPDFTVADEAQRAAAWPWPPSARTPSDDDRAYAKVLRDRNLVDLDELITLPVALLRDDRDLLEEYRARWPWLFVDEYQDIDDDAVRAAAPAGPDGRQHLRDRRPRPGDLLVPGRGRRATSCGSGRTSPTPGWSG